MLPRTRLVEGLHASSARVVLLEAPAGYSKTTTLKLWEEADSRPFAWVRLEPRYNDPALLVEVIVGALGSTGIAPGTLAELEFPVPDLGLRLQRIAAALAELEAFVLVFDDAHLLEEDAAWQVLYSVIAAMPERSRVAIATRTHPGLPVGRLRARRELHELRMTDLALTRRESRELLAGLDLELGERADEIHTQAEGWPAALYLAGLAIRQDREAKPESADFDGGDRIVVEYFRDEFFQDMPEAKAAFLYETSILEELNGPLCDAVTGRDDSRRVLAELAAENALIVPLDRNGDRFRYHHLFRDMLRSELSLRDSEAKPDLHRRAAIWLAANGEITRATDHAIIAQDWELAGAYIWLDIPELLGRGRVATLDRWFEAIGDDRIARVPALILARAHREIAMGCGDESFYWLSIAEREIDESSPVYGDVFALRATIGPNGTTGMIEDGERAAKLVAPSSPWQVPAKLYQGVGLFLSGDAAAELVLRETAREAVRVSSIIQVMALIQLALGALDQGQVDQADGHISRAREVVEHSGLRILRVMSLVYVVLALVRATQGRVEDAREEIETGQRIGEGMVDFVAWHQGELVATKARVFLRCGQFDLAEEQLRLAETQVQLIPGASRLEGWIADCREGLERSRAVGNGSPLNLTRAELRTLQFLPSHHSFRAIGEQLYLSQNTVKTQANSLYRKLGVNSRAEAVMEGRRLGLLNDEAE
jgi:LuxR family maltose regulon positive regulatory protein